MVNLFHLLRNCQTISHNSCTVLHAQQQCSRVSMSPYPWLSLNLVLTITCPLEIPLKGKRCCCDSAVTLKCQLDKVFGCVLCFNNSLGNWAELIYVVELSVPLPRDYTVNNEQFTAGFLAEHALPSLLLLLEAHPITQEIKAPFFRRMKGGGRVCFGVPRFCNTIIYTFSS